MPSEYPDSVLQAALCYARRGWYVLPLTPGQKTPYSALVPHGWHDATNDPDIIREWWKEPTELGIGISLEQSGLMCIDIDTHDGIDGHDLIERLEHEHGKLETNCIQLTPSGGEHRLFANPERLHGPAKFEADKGGVDIKWNGYICAQPTKRADCDNIQYEWEASSDPLEHDEPVTPMPDWIRALAAPKEEDDAPAAPLVQHVTDWQWAEIRSALKYIPALERNDWLNVGFALHSTGRPDAREMWDEWSLTCPAKFDAQTQERTWESFHARGWDGIGPRTIFAMAKKAGWGGMSKSEAAEFQGADESSGAPEQARAKKPNLIKLYTEVLAASFQQRWLIKEYFPMNSIGVIYGKSGAGKSWIAVDIALHAALGLSWCGKKTKKVKVLYIAAEGGYGLSQRVEAFRIGHKVEQADINENFSLIAGAVNLSEPDALKTPLATATDIDEMMAAKDIVPGLVVIDTLSQTLSGADENDASAIAQYMNNLAQAFRDKYHCCVIVIHHSGKGDQTTPRGSSAIQANTSFLYQVTREGTQKFCTLSCSHMKDASAPDAIQFLWKEAEICKDEDGDPVDSIYIMPEGWPDPKSEIGQAAMAPQKKAGRPKAKESMAEALAKKFFPACMKKYFDLQGYAAERETFYDFYDKADPKHERSDSTRSGWKKEILEKFDQLFGDIATYDAERHEFFPKKTSE